MTLGRELEKALGAPWLLVTVDVDNGIELDGPARIQIGLVGDELRGTHTVEREEPARWAETRGRPPRVSRDQTHFGILVQRCCVAHDDCREHPELGVECWLARPMVGT